MSTRELISVLLVGLCFHLGGSTHAEDEGNAVHQPRFFWKDSKILDGDRPIANLVVDSYMGPRLMKVVLRPGGRPLVDWAIGWRAQFVTSTCEMDRISAKGEGSGKLELEIVSHTPDSHYGSETSLVLTHDESVNSYVYEVSTSLVMHKFPFKNWRDFCGKCTQWYLTVPVEFANVKPIGLTTWQSWIYRNPAGGWTRIPLHHLWVPGFYSIRFNRKQGVLGLFDSPQGNPVVEFLDNTGANCEAAHCFAAYDMHLKCLLNMYARKFWAKYRLLCYDAKRSRPITKAARRRVYSPDELEVYGLPRFTAGKANDFTKGIDITRNDQGLFWIPYGDVSSSQWLKRGGYKGAGCIRTEGAAPVSASWQVTMFAPRIARGKRYVFSARVRTKGLEGEGACLSCKIGKKTCTSAKLTGDNDWTKVEIAISAPTADKQVQEVALQHKGKGCSLFSNVEFREVKP